MLFQPTDSNSGQVWPEPILTAQGALTPTHTHTGTTLARHSHHTHTSFGCGRKLDFPQKTYADMGRTWKLHQDIFFFLINFILKHHRMK